MKLLTEEEQQDHLNAVYTGGALGGVAGLAVGGLGVYAASVRYPAFRQLTLPMRAFLVTSSATFAAIVSADSYSRAHEKARNPEYVDQQTTLQQQIDAQKTQRQRTMDWLSENRYSIVFGSWVASMATAMGIVGRNPYLTGQQKLVQARVYAQGLTIAVVIISLAFETNDSRGGKGRWETVKIIDPNDPEHKHVIEKKIHHEAYAGEDQWRDMVEAEEQKMKEREEAHKQRHQKNNGKAEKSKSSNESKESKGDEKKSDDPKESKSDEKKSK